MKLNNKYLDKEKGMAYLLILPVVMYYLIFWLCPVYKAVIEAFTDIGGGFSFKNYLRLLAQPDIQKAFIYTLVFAAVSMLIQFFLSIGVALLLNKKFKFSNLVLFITLIPMAFPPAAVAILWKSGFYKFGWINSILYHLHLVDSAHLIDWMSFSSLKAVFFLIVIDTWTVLPSVVIILLAGLQNLNKEFEEAGWVFGANRFQTIKDIVIPIMKPTIVTAMILRLIAAIQVWLIAVIIFGYNATPFLVERIAYNVDVITFTKYAKKDAYALSVVVVILVMTATYSYIRSSNRSQKQDEVK
jgi:multiple sugar transport system permease protein